MYEKKIEKIALLGAMPQEILAYKNKIDADGCWNGKKVDVGETGVGKPAAAATTALASDKYDLLIFTGVAGALDSDLKIGDIGIVAHAIDADLDVRIWGATQETPYLRGEVPFTRDRVFRSDDYLVEKALEAPIDSKVFQAYVASGSAFVDVESKAKFNKYVSPDLEAEINGVTKRPDLYDMETSAVLQIANKYKTPVLVIRAVSDTTSGDAPKDFNEFVEGAVEQYVGIVEHLLKEL